MDSTFFTTISMIMFMIGINMNLKSFTDMKNCDMNGISDLKRFNKEGTEFPLPFVMKNMSRLGLSCRHPLDGGMLLIFASSVISNRLTLGRLIFAIMFTIGVLIGNHFEERDVYKKAGK